MRPAQAGFAIILFVLMLSSTPAGAQVLIGYLLGTKLSTPTFNMGFEVGVNFANLDGVPDADRIHRPVFGLVGDWRFSEHFHLVSAILPVGERGAEGIAPVATGDPGFDVQTVGATMKRTLNYLEVPLLLSWAPQREEGFRAGAGPSFGFVTGATDRYACTTLAGLHYALEREVGGQLPGFDFGLSVDAEWRLKMLSVAVRYTRGLTDMRQDGTPDAVHTQTLTGTGRIYLGKKPT
jgi:hypothetical protein